MWNPNDDFERLIKYFAKDEANMVDSVVLILLKTAYSLYGGKRA